MVTVRPAVKRGLERLRLLDAAREARGVVSSLPWLLENTAIRLRGADDGLPLPPLRLVRSSTGTSSLRWLLDGGALAAQCITEVLARNGADIRGCPRVLDFGCGCGRVLRRWARLPAEMHGSDYNRRAVDWCRRHLPFARCSVNALEPPLPYDDEHFDLIYALSVFTHLPEPLMHRWMRELERVTRPGGFLIISTHGEAYAAQLTPDEHASFRAGHVVVRDSGSSGTNRCGAYFSEEFIRTRLASGFAVVDVIPRGAKGNPEQDLTLLRKRARA